MTSFLRYTHSPIHMPNAFMRGSIAVLTGMSLLMPSLASIVDEIYPRHPKPTPKKYWFSFGDSYSQTWFNVSDPAGQPNLSNAMGNPPYPGYTACGFVPNWIYDTTFVYNSSFVYVYNHAYGGAVISDELVTPWKEGLKHLDDQMDDFLNFNAPQKQFYPGWTGSNAIFAFFIGINDIGNSFYLDQDHSAFNQLLINKYFEIVKKAVKVGARNFLFLTVPPTERSPLMLTYQDAAGIALLKQVRQDYNAKLRIAAKQLERNHTGVSTMIYDTEPIVNLVLDHPERFGIVNSTAYGDGDDKAWCNDYHISPRTNLEIAKGVARLLKPRFI